MRRRSVGHSNWTEKYLVKGSQYGGKAGFLKRRAGYWPITPPLTITEEKLLFSSVL